MKYKALGCVALGVAALTLASCDFSVPKSLRVKASPTVNAAFGSTSFEMADYFSVTDVTDAFASGSTSQMKVYDYIDSTEPEVQKFLMHMKVMEMPISMSEYLGNLDISGSLSVNLQNQTVAVPAIGFTAGNSMSLDIASVFQNNLSAVGSVTASAPELGASGSAIIPAPTISLSGFSTVTFGSGSLDITFSVPDTAPANYTLVITGVALLKASDDSLIASSTGSANAKASGVISVPLTGVTLPNQIKVEITATTSGGTPPNLQTLTVTPAFTNCTISAATGFSVNETLAISPPALSLGDTTNFVEATIGTGQINLVVSPLPSNITGLDRSLDLRISQNGVDIYNQTGVSLEGLTDNTLVIPLNGTTLDDNPISVSGTVYVTGGPAGTAATNLGSAAIPVDWSVESDISLFSAITLSGFSEFGSPQTFNEPVTTDSALYKWVDLIRFDKVGLSLNYTNGLPAGNDFTLRVNSVAFGITNQDGTLAGSSTAADVEVVNDAGDGRDDPTNDYPFDPQGLGPFGIDFSITVLPPGYNSGEFTLQNLVPGSSYAFSVNDVSVVSDWYDAVITPSQNFTGEYPEAAADPIDLSMLTDYLGEGLSFSEIGARLYIGGKSATATQQVDLQGVMQAIYHYPDPTDTVEPISLLEDSVYLQNPLDTADANPASLVFASRPVLPDGTLYDDRPGADTPLPTPSLDISTALTDVFNTKPKDMRLSYDIAANSVTLGYNDLDSDAIVSVDLVLILPLSLSIPAEGADINLTKFIAGDSGTADDMFGRDPGEVDENLEKGLDSLLSMGLNMEMVNRTGVSGDFHLLGSNGFDATFTIDSGETVQMVPLGLTYENIQAMKTSPFTFEAIRIVPSGGATSIDLNRQADGTKSLEILSMTARVATEVDQTVDF